MDREDKEFSWGGSKGGGKSDDSDISLPEFFQGTFLRLFTELFSLSLLILSASLQIACLSLVTGGRVSRLVFRGRARRGRGETTEKNKSRDCQSIRSFSLERTVID